VSQPEIAKNLLNPLIFRGSRSFKLISVGTPGELVSSAFLVSKFVFIFSRSHATRVNGKITISQGASSFDVLVRWESPYPAARNSVTRNYRLQAIMQRKSGVSI